MTAEVERGHRDPDCAGFWVPCAEARLLLCSGCAARFAPTPDEVLAALNENALASLALRLTREGVEARSPIGGVREGRVGEAGGD